MAEVEYKGIKIGIGGNKLLLIIPLLATISGGLWGGFEFWKDYQNLQKTVKNIVLLVRMQRSVLAVLLVLTVSLGADRLACIYQI